jgi:translocation and assembly module TamB
VTELSVVRISRGWWKYLFALAGAGVILGLTLLWYINTESFQKLVRQRLIAEIERVTGGRAEIGSFHVVPFRMQVDLRDINVHGRESLREVPLAHADRFVAQLKASSLIRSELGFHEVYLDRPVIHVIFYPDGTTNVPQPKISDTSGGTSIEQLFALSTNRLEVHRGELLWDDQVIPLDFSVRGTELQMNYSFLRGRYDGRLLLGKVDSKFDDCRPFAWMSSMEFSLASTFMDITSLKWSSGRSQLEGHGRISNFRRPHVQGVYEARVDLTEAGAIARRHELQGGVLDLKGQGDWSIERFNANGQLTLHDLAMQSEQVSFAKGSIESDYAMTESHIKLSKLQGKLFGGFFTGDAELIHWFSPAQHLASGKNAAEGMAVITAGRAEVRAGAKGKRQAQPEIQNGLITLRLRDLSIDEVAAGIEARTKRLGRFHPAGMASGTLETRWKGTPRDAEVEFSLDVNPPGHGVAGRLPVTAHAKGTYHAGEDALDLPQFTLSTPATRVQASGSVSDKSVLRLSISTSSLDEWQSLIAAFRGPAPFPLTLNQSAAFNGTLTGGFSYPILSGGLSINDFDVTLPATERTSQQQVHWDSLSTTVQLSSHAITLHNSILRRGDTSADFDVSATLQDGHFNDDSPFTLRANLHNFDVAALQALAGYNYPITGTADLFVQASGSRTDPRGQGKIHLNNATAHGELIQQFDADIHLAQGEAAFDNIRLVHYDSVVTGSAAYNPSTRVFQLDLSGNNFDLARVRQIHSDRVSIEGRADFTLKGSGTPDTPSINADIHVRDLTVDRQLEGELDLQAVTQNQQLHLTGNSHFQHGSLLVDGNVQLRDDYPANLSLRMDHLDLNALLQAYSRVQVTGQSTLAGTLEMHGPLRRPDQWTLDGNISDLSLNIENVSVHNAEPVRIGLANDILRIERLHLLGQGTDFSAEGSIQISGDRELDLSADGSLDLKLLSTFDSDLTATGLAKMNVTVQGTLDEPLPQGQIQLTNGTVSYAGLPSGLSELNGSFVFTRDRLHIENLSARTGGGSLDLKGDASYYNQQLNFNLAATGKGVRLRYPPGVSSTADAELRWVGSRSSSTVTGNILVTKIAVTPGFDFSSYLDRSRQLSSVTAANSPLYNVKLDIHVRTAPELQMRTAVARLSGDADLRLRGSAARPALLGRADILEGQATFHGTKLTLERGDITFANPVAIEPQLNLQASTHVRNYDLNITVTGTPDRGLNINYRSEPPLPKSDIIALLALGRTNQESEQLQEQSGQSAFSDQATALILNQALNATVSSRLQRLFGTSNIKIDPQGLSTETNPTARGPQLTIEQEFANNLTLSYSTNVSQSSQQIIQGEYYFNRNLSAVGTRDQNGVVSFDVRIRRQKK